MKYTKFILAATIILAMYSVAKAVPACPQPAVVTQPDGTTLTIRLHGDEFYSYTTTEDGYVIARNSEGYYCYAPGNGTPTSVRAHDAAHRDATELSALSSMRVHDVPAMKDALDKGRAERSRFMNTPKRNAEGDINFHGLVILVEFTDCQFTRPDMQQVLTDMLNQENYTGYSDYETGEWQQFTGSAHDYFRDASGGNFMAHFDVSEPVQVPYSVYTGRNNYGSIFGSALYGVADQFDFSQYDNNNDGYVDMVFFVVAGYGSNYSGNDERLLWPHMSGFGNGPEFDGKQIMTYACSTELHGWEQWGGQIAGIGTFCHEFSHTQGLPDLYDTNYETGGQSVTPGVWDVMSGGSYLNDGRTPPTYSVLERELSRFIDLTPIEEPGEYAIEEVMGSNSGLIFGWDGWAEWILMENRHREGWDAYLPGEGMLVWQVDQRDMTLWNYNQINAYPESNGVRLLRAAEHDLDSPHNPFPGQSNVTSLTNETGLRSNVNYPSPFEFTDIRCENGVIKLNINAYNWFETLETFESQNLSNTVSDFTFEGDWCTVAVTSGRISSVESQGQTTNVVTLAKHGVIELGEVYNPTSMVFDLDSSVNDAFVTVQMSVDGGVSWQPLRNSEGGTPAYDYAVGMAPVQMSVTEEVDPETPVRLRIKNGMKEVRVDNIRVLCDRVSAIEGTPADDLGYLRASVCDGTLRVYTPVADDYVAVYDTAGVKVGESRAAAGVVSFTLHRGIYLVRCAGETLKIRL